VVVWGYMCGFIKPSYPFTALGNLGNSVGPFLATACVGRWKTSGLWHQSEGCWKINLTCLIFAPWKSVKDCLEDFLENISEDWPMVYRKTKLLAILSCLKKKKTQIMDSDITKTHLLSLDRLYTLNFEQKWTK